MIKTLKLKKAVSLAEVLITLVVIGIIAGIMYPMLHNTKIAFVQKTASLKANSDIKEIIGYMLENTIEYKIKNNFSINNTTQRDLFYNSFKNYILNPEETTCPAYADGRIIASTNCIIGNSGSAWVIPSLTDFATIGVVYIEENGHQIPYVPITVYPYYKATVNGELSANLEEHFARNAVLYGIRADGHIIFLDSVMNRYVGENHNLAMHYKLKDYLKLKED